MPRKKRIEPIPEDFATCEAAAEFWDTHNTTDYPRDFRIVEIEAEFRGRRYEIELEEDVVRALQSRARRRGVGVGRLASSLLRKHLAAR